MTYESLQSRNAGSQYSDTYPLKLQKVAFPTKQIDFFYIHTYVYKIESDNSFPTLEIKSILNRLPSLTIWG